MKIIKLGSAMCGAILALSLAAIPAKAEVIENGATPTGVPFNFLDPKTNTMGSFLLDVAAAVAKRGKFEFSLQTSDFQSLVPAMESKRIDIITSSVSPRFLASALAALIASSFIEMKQLAAGTCR